MAKPIRLTGQPKKWFDADKARQFSPPDSGSATAQERLMVTSHRHFVLSQLDASQVRTFSEVDSQTAASWLDSNGYPEAAEQVRNSENYEAKDEI